MNPIVPAELSAYIDGEVSPQRAREIEAALQTDAALRATFDALSKLDTSWRAAAQAAAFAPKVHVPVRTRRGVSAVGVAALLFCLVAWRVLPGLGEVIAAGFALHGAALAIVLVWIVRMARRDAVA